MAVAALSLVVLGPLLCASDAWSRAGGGGSKGSRGSRGISAPVRPAPAPVSPARPAVPESAPRAPQPAARAAPREPELTGGGRLVGFLTGNLLGTLLLGGGSGLGFGDVVIVGLLAYVAFKLAAGSREAAPARAGARHALTSYARSSSSAYGSRSLPRSAGGSLYASPRPINRRDEDEAELARTAMDLFLKVQAAWPGRDVEPIIALLTLEMQHAFQTECDQMRAEGQINRLESITVRGAQIVKSWQDRGHDFVTIRLDAALLDYTTDEKSGEVLAGSPTEPVRFRELWTLTRPIWAKAWRLSATQPAAPASS